MNILSRRGFTLIELLVSISIIAILTALLSVNFISARERGRDGQRKSNVLQMQTAFELMRSDKGYYPSGADLINCGVPLQFSQAGTKYMTKIPCDPGSGGSPYRYVPSPSGCLNSGNSTSCSSYTLFACLENADDRDAADRVAYPNNLTGCDSSTVPFMVTTP